MTMRSRKNQFEKQVKISKKIIVYTKLSIVMMYRLKYNYENNKTLGQGRVNLSVFSKRVEEG